jgi:uncharacterized membrane protein
VAASALVQHEIATSRSNKELNVLTNKSRQRTATGKVLYQNLAPSSAKRVRNTVIFPLAKLVPSGVLTAIALISALYIINNAEIPNAWVALGLLPLVLYLAACHRRARRLLLAEEGREREIIHAGFVALAAQRAARFWGGLFASIVITTGVTSVAFWIYQGFLFYTEDRWIPVTWFAVTGVLPVIENTYLQRLSHWLADTNMGVAILVVGLLLAAPVAAIHWRSNNKVKFRKNDLANLKKRS